MTNGLRLTFLIVFVLINGFIVFSHPIDIKTFVAIFAIAFTGLLIVVLSVLPNSD